MLKITFFYHQKMDRCRTMTVCSMLVIMSALCGLVYPAGFPGGGDVRGSELMKEKRGFPGEPQRGSGFLDLKRNGLEAMALLNEEAYAKRAYQQMEKEHLNRLRDQEKAKAAAVSQSNYRSGLNVRRVEYPLERKQPGFTWPDDMNVDVSSQRHPETEIKRNYDIPREMMSFKRDDYHTNKEFVADKRNKFGDFRGEPSWKRHSSGEQLPGNLQYVPEDDPRLY